MVAERTVTVAEIDNWHLDTAFASTVWLASYFDDAEMALVVVTDNEPVVTDTCHSVDSPAAAAENASMFVVPCDFDYSTVAAAAAVDVALAEPVDVPVAFVASIASIALLVAVALDTGLEHCFDDSLLDN